MRATAKGLRVAHRSANQTSPHSDQLLAQIVAEWEERRANTPAQPFDPHLLVRLAREQWAPIPQLAVAFALCTQQWAESELYTRLHPLLAEWRFAANVPLAHPTWGTLLVDILHHPTLPGVYAIGGIEFLDRVMGRHMPVPELMDLMGWGNELFPSRKEYGERAAGGL